MTAILTAESKHSATLGAEAKGIGGAILANGGQYYGFMAFTYSGGQQLVPGHLPVLTSQGKNATSLTAQTRN